MKPTSKELVKQRIIELERERDYYDSCVLDSGDPWDRRHTNAALLKYIEELEHRIESLEK